MFKSLFSKIFITYLTILAAIMTVLAVMLTYLADAYVYAQKKDMLDSVAYKVETLTNEYMLGVIDNDRLTEALDAMGYITDTKIYVIKGGASSGRIDLDGGIAEDFIADALAKALSGETIFLRRQYFSGYGEQIVLAAYPWENGGGIEGALLLISPEETVSVIVGGIRLAICLAAAAFVALGGVVIYFFTRRLITPIREIEAASARMANGEPTPDIEIRTEDELGALSRSFNSMKNKIQKDEQFRSELISNLSHDLRTPLTNINGFLCAMADGMVREKDYPKTIGVIREEVKRLTDLTDDILQTAKIQSDQIELNLSPFALKPLVEAVISAADPSAKAKGVVVTADVPVDLFAAADRKKIEQVLHNLIGNAVKYADMGTEVHVSARDEGEAVSVSILDFGEVISETDLPHVFDRYYRASWATAGGFGLGLCIAKTYVDAHGGQIAAKSSAKEGTVFTFTLPKGSM